MKIWYLYYNEKTKQIDYAEHSVKDFRSDWETPSNVDEFKHQCNTAVDHAIKAAECYNRDLQSFELQIHKCKDCGIYFFTSTNEELWFKANNLSVPKRCNKCRAKRRKSA